MWCAYRPAAQAVQFRETVSTPWHGRHRRPANVRDHTCVSRLRARRRWRSSRRAEKTSSGRNPTTLSERDRLSSDGTEQRRDRVERVPVDVAEAVIVEIQYLQYSRRPSKNQKSQEAQLSPSDRAMRLVSSNLPNYHATVQKLLVRQVLTKPMVWSWSFSWRQCVINKPTTVELCISPVYRRLAVAKFSKSTM